MSEKFHFECIDCKAEYPGDELIYLCPACEKINQPGQPPRGVLKTIYDYSSIRGTYSRKRLFKTLQQDHFLPLLPIVSFGNWSKLRIGGTPLYGIEKIEKIEGIERIEKFELFLKDDSQNPTFSFKDRASALVSAWAKEHGIEMLVAASTGNAGSSLAGICASQRQKAVIVVPATAPLAKLTQVLMYGATLIPVNGTYDEAFDLSVKLSEKYGWYNRNTAYNPLTIEGKKTVSFEIFSDLGQRTPDRIFIPVGDGVIFSGVCKGFEELLMLGIIDRMPILVAVQSEGSANLVHNLETDQFVSKPSVTLADSISVDIPRNFFMTKHYFEKYRNEWITVTDSEIISASVSLARSSGIFSEPAAVAAFAGMLKYKAQGLIPSGDLNVVLLTGSGLKDPAAARSLLSMPEPVKPDISAIGHLISDLLHS
ncbi:MAG: threonine synthase [Bacteroidetes bacterium]|nr:threonine synthase [Bacteroidota bacterium]